MSGKQQEHIKKKKPSPISSTIRATLVRSPTIQTYTCKMCLSKTLTSADVFCDAEGDKDADVIAFVALSHQTINRDAPVTAS